MAEKTEAQKKAQQKYMEKFAVARVRMEQERYAAVQAHADAQGESVNAFINRAISETMERDKEIDAADITAENFGITREQVFHAYEFSNVMDRLATEYGLSKWELLEKIAKLKEEAGE